MTDKTEYEIDASGGCCLLLILVVIGGVAGLGWLFGYFFRLAIGAAL